LTLATAIVRSNLCVLLIGASVFAQSDKSLYVITARPNGPSVETFSASLQVIDPEGLTLKPLREVVPNNIGVSFVLSNDSARVVIIGSPPDLQRQFNIIDMDHPDQVRSVEIFREGLRPITWHILTPPGRPKYFALQIGDLVHRPIQWLSIGVDLTTKKEVSVPWDDYQYANLSGFQGWSPPNRDELNLFQFDDGRLTTREGRVVTKTEWVLPKQYRFSEGTWITALVNNAGVLALGGAGEGGDPKMWNIRVLDKKENRWGILSVPGGLDETRGFGDWLVVTVQDEAKPRKFAGSREDDVLLRRYTFDSRMRGNNLYRPGILILYNAHTRQECRIETHQADSEVILIQDATVYYRVNRSIWQAQIGPKGLSAPVLVADDPAVVDAHWAFQAPIDFHSAR